MNTCKHQQQQLSLDFYGKLLKKKTRKNKECQSFEKKQVNNNKKNNNSKNSEVK